MGFRSVCHVTEFWEWLVAVVVSLGAMVSLALLLVAATGPRGAVALPREGGLVSCSGTGSARECASGEQGLVCTLPGQPTPSFGSRSSLVCGEGARLCALGCGSVPGDRVSESGRHPVWAGMRAYWLATGVVCAWVLSLTLIGHPFRARRCVRRHSRGP